jgi:hypothetical protein
LPVNPDECFLVLGHRLSSSDEKQLVAGPPLVCRVGGANRRLRRRTYGLTGKGGPVRWELLKDESAPNGPTVLAETSGDRTSNRFPLAILKGFEVRDVEVRVRFKPTSGKVDQAAGLVVRLRDPGNYYIARANALEDNVRRYKVVDGKRQQFAGVDIEVPKGQWQELGLRVEGDRLTVSLDGKELFSATDRTFAQAGRVGLWTKADSLTHFDDLVARRLQ